MIETLLDLATETLTARSRPQLYCECRQCGTTVSPDDAVCPCCESEEIARLELR